jgi:glycosyltransferase involved in cell wall biosynthesis
MRVLLITSRFPVPRRRGNQVRTGEWLAALRDCQLGLVAPAPRRRATLTDPSLHRVTTFLYPPGLLAPPLGAVAALLRRRPVQEGLYATAAAHRALRRALADGPWDVVVVQMVRCAWAVEVLASAAPQVPVLFDAIDAMSLHYRRSGCDFPLWLRPLVSLEAVRCRRREQWLVDRACVTTAVAGRDLAALGCPPEQGRVVPVAGQELTGATEPSREPIVLLSGNLGYRPTVSGALWFSREVLPDRRAAIPGVRWRLAGARPVAAIRRLARQDGIEVHADVDDLAPFLAGAAVAIAPMSTGSGVPMKVLEAWAAGLPVVAAPWAAAGLQSDAGEGLIVAESAGEWVAALTHLLEDRSHALAVARRGRAIWDRWYRPDQVEQMIRDAVNAARKHQGGTAATKVCGAHGVRIIE